MASFLIKKSLTSFHFVPFRGFSWGAAPGYINVAPLGLFYINVAPLGLFLSYFCFSNLLGYIQKIAIMANE